MRPNSARNAKTAKTLIKKYGSDYFKQLGRKGGLANNKPRYFSDPENARTARRKASQEKEQENENDREFR